MCELNVEYLKTFEFDSLCKKIELSTIVHDTATII